MTVNCYCYTSGKSLQLGLCPHGEFIFGSVSYGTSYLYCVSLQVLVFLNPNPESLLKQKSSHTNIFSSGGIQKLFFIGLVWVFLKEFHFYNKGNKIMFFW